MSRLPFTVSALCFALLVPPLHAQSPRLGRIVFPTSGRAEAQPLFIRGVLYLHSFEYDSAASAFREAQRLDPNYAMAFWGEAMTYTHPVWYQQDLSAARAALQRFASTVAERRSKAPTAREKRWFDAIEVLYGDGAKEERDTLYAREMERFARDYPGDHEVQTLYALSLLGLSSRGRDAPTYMRAAAIAEEVYRENPEHPGALHILIHSYDDPVHAPLGMRAARAYSVVAPSAAHAQHMTSHIFVSMGMWDDVERANIAAWEASNRRNGHYTHWLSYGYLQKGRVKDARTFVAAVMSDAASDPTPYKLGYMNTMLAGYLMDAEEWNSPWARFAADSAKRAGGPGAFHPAAVALDFAAGVAALKRGDAATARRLRGSLAARVGAARAPAGDGYVPGRASAEIMGQMLDALTLASTGQMDAAISVTRDAATREASLPFEFGPPETIKPPYELLGELLLTAERAADARAAFEQALSRTPNRSRSVLGLARAYAALGNMPAGAQHYARFLANCAGAEERSQDMKEAEAFLSKAERR
ncbi:MAG: tetratricopeptide repeat protein [Gemmatimonadaceae bacterium]